MNHALSDEKFLNDYLERYRRAFLEATPSVYREVSAFRDLAREIREADRKLLFAGNGASASICSHLSVDFTKQGGVRAMNFNEANLLTCFGNDYGYENWVTEALKAYADEGDVVVLISSSGTSRNIVNAAMFARSEGLKLITFSGFAPDNPLRKSGDISFWVNSLSYNVVECTHMIWGTMVIDLLIGEVEYSVS